MSPSRHRSYEISAPVLSLSLPREGLSLSLSLSLYPNVSHTFRENVCVCLCNMCACVLILTHSTIHSNAYIRTHARTHAPIHPCTHATTHPAFLHGMASEHARFHARHLHLDRKAESSASPIETEVNTFYLLFWYKSTNTDAADACAAPRKGTGEAVGNDSCLHMQHQQ